MGTVEPTSSIDPPQFPSSPGDIVTLNATFISREPISTVLNSTLPPSSTVTLTELGANPIVAAASTGDHMTQPYPQIGAVTYPH